MEPNWKNIKEEIAQKEAPLSDEAWSHLHKALDTYQAKRRIFMFLPAVLLLIAIPVAIHLLHRGIKSKSTEAKPETEWLKPEADVAKNKTSITNQSPSLLEEKQKADADKVASKPESQKIDVAALGSNTLAPKENANYTLVPSNNPMQTEFTEHTAQEETTITSVTENEIHSKQGVEDSNALVKEKADSIPILTNTEEQPNTSLTPYTNAAKWELKLYAGPTYNNPNITYTQKENYTHKEYGGVSNNSVKQGWGFDAGIEISYFVTPRFKVSTGIGYRNIITTNSMNYSVNEIPVIDSASGRILGYITLPQSVAQSNSSQNSFVYVGVPVSLFKEIPLRGRFSITAEFVNTFSFLVKQNSKEINPTTLQIEGASDAIFNPLLLTYQLRLGVRYRLNQTISLALEPAYRGTYNNIYSSDYISWKPNDFSVNAALIIQLHKK